MEVHRPTPGAIKQSSLTPERKLRFLSQYMNERIDLWPKSIKPFNRWLEGMLDSKAHKGLMKQIEVRKKKCRYCNQQFVEDIEELQKTKDHIIPTSKGGLNNPHNKVNCCNNCNQWKKDKLPEEWLKEVKKWAKRQEDNPHYTVAQIGLMVSNIKAVSQYARDNQKKISLYRWW